MLKSIFIFCLIAAIPYIILAQNNTNDLLDSLSENAGREIVRGTFKGTRVINGQSVENIAGGTMQVLISHRFGTVNNGIYDFMGLDNATIRLGVEYGITDALTVGIGRSSFEKTYDGFVKYKVLQQTTGEKSMPLSLVLFSSIASNTLRFANTEQYRDYSSRLSYTYQLIAARKFSERLSLQVSPTIIHRNFIETKEDENDIYSTGFAGRFKLTKRLALTAEYFYVFPYSMKDNFQDAFSMGLDIETGGHVFQLIFTNSQGMIEKSFIPQTTAAWYKRQIYFGFNISRVFTLKSSKR